MCRFRRTTSAVCRRVNGLHYRQEYVTKNAVRAGVLGYWGKADKLFCKMWLRYGDPKPYKVAGILPLLVIAQFCCGFEIINEEEKKQRLQNKTLGGTRYHLTKTRMVSTDINKLFLIMKKCLDPF